MRLRAREERDAIVLKYDRGREEGAVIDQWEDPKFEIYHTQDRYGFIHDERLPENGRTERELRNVEKEMSRAAKWVAMTKHPQKFFEPGAKHRDTMVGRVWKGVPLKMRGELWRILLDIDTLEKQHKSMFQKMKMSARKYSPDIRQIDLDVNRTYRNHVMFRERYNVKQQDLFHVLAAYSMYNTEVGYCQGMSQVAALLLMYLNSEEDAFWGLHQLMVGDKYKMHGFFIPHFPKLLRFQEHFDKLLLKKLYRLQKHLVKNEVVSGIYTLKWFFQCFLDRLPYSLTLRVWDLYLLEGEDIMFGMAYTILKMHRQRLMKMGMDELLEFILKTLETNFYYDDDTVIDALRQNLQDLRSSRLNSAGESPANEEPNKPFGLDPQWLNAEREIGHRQPITDKERDFSLLTIQRENETARKLLHINSQTSIDEGSYDHSLNETVSVEPDTEDQHSDLLDQDLSMEISDSPHTSNLGDASDSHTPTDRTGAGGQSNQSTAGKYPILPPSPLPPSKEQDELDNTLLSMMKQVGSLEIRSADNQRQVQASKAQHINSNSNSLTANNISLDTRPASADPHKNITKDDRKRHSAHVALVPSRGASPAANLPAASSTGHLAADVTFTVPHIPHSAFNRSVPSPNHHSHSHQTPPRHHPADVIAVAQNRSLPRGTSRTPYRSHSPSSAASTNVAGHHRRHHTPPPSSSSATAGHANASFSTPIQDKRTREGSSIDRNARLSPQPPFSDRHTGGHHTNHTQHNTSIDSATSTAGGNSRLRSGSRSSRTSRGSRASRTYYYGETTEQVGAGTTVISNGSSEPQQPATPTLAAEQQQKQQRDLLNSSFEGATPHTGEVVRIRVPFDESVSSGAAGSGVGVGLGALGGVSHDVAVGGIEREDKEISPRYNGHKVTIQVNRPGHEADPSIMSPPTGFKSKQISSHQVTKKFVSSSERKVSSSSEEVHRSSHSVLMHSINHSNSQGEVRSLHEFAETRTRDGRVVAQAQHTQQSKTQHPPQQVIRSPGHEFHHASSPQMFPVFRSISPNPSSTRENRNSRSSLATASDKRESTVRRETFF